MNLFSIFPPRTRFACDTVLTIVLCGWLAVCFVQAQSPAPLSQHKPLPPGYAGAETCSRCHISNSFSLDATPHKGVEKDGVVGCEVCHGPGAGHAGGNGDRSKIFLFDPEKDSSRERCLSCHTEAHRDSRPAHRELNCLQCHTVHHSKESPLLRMPRAKLCQNCHE